MKFLWCIVRITVIFAVATITDGCRMLHVDSLWEGIVYITIYDKTTNSFVDDITLSLVTRENIIGHTNDLGLYEGEVSVWWGEKIRRPDQFKGPLLFIIKPDYCDLSINLPLVEGGYGEKLHINIVLECSGINENNSIAVTVSDISVVPVNEAQEVLKIWSG